MTIPGLDEYVAKVLADFPPLTAEQRDRLGVILHKREGAVPTVSAPSRTATTIYRHFDACGCLLYIGIAYDAVRRSYAHAGSSWWTKWTDRIDLQAATYENRSDAVDAERAFIQSERPIFNKVHAPDRDKSVVRYLIDHGQWGHLSVAAPVGKSALPDLLRTLAQADLLGDVMWTKVES